MGCEDRPHGPAAEPCDDREGCRHEEEEQVHDLVGLREQPRPGTLGRVEHHQLHGHGERQQHQHPGTHRAAWRHGCRDRDALPRAAHTGSRAATAARTASATTVLTSGWNTLGMM